MCYVAGVVEGVGKRGGRVEKGRGRTEGEGYSRRRAKEGGVLGREGGGEGMALKGGGVRRVVNI
jgi:hypothetical protein